ncbi:hypothetical protein [Paenibacillus sp. NPDC058174]|uniref:hypothetical protein n=1 Tax=Paenibacillus sp. NPDC058174 TaxID=3346366 RepID=UPI0036DC15FC
MIRINVDGRADLYTIELKHWSYFKDNHLPKLEDVLARSRTYNRRTYRFLRQRIKDVVLGKPDVLAQLIRDLPPATNEKMLKDDLKRIFDYSSFRRALPPNWGAYQFVKELDVKICPYCNRQYIYTVCSDSGRTRGSLDHFFDKTRYPFLGLSMYNLIPSCKTCNSDLKNTKDFMEKDYLHPYFEEFGDTIRFGVELKNGNPLKVGEEYQINFLTGSGDEFDIVIRDELCLDDSLKSKAKHNRDVFKINEFYNMHKDYVVELIKKRVMYPDSHINDLFNRYEGLLFSSREDVIQTILSNYVSLDHLDKRVLAKLARDISRELGLNIY